MKIKFDTIRFTTDSNNLIDYNSDYFKNDVDLSTGELKSATFNSQSGRFLLPFNIYIYANFSTNMMTIEFSSKVLLDDYTKLISDETFPLCLENINKFGMCTLNIEGILSNCYFNKLHITKDIDLTLTNKMLSDLNRCTRNFRRYNWNVYGNNGIAYTNNVITPKSKEQIILYNKQTEISQSKNQAFLNMTNNRDEIIDYFRDKTRVEVKYENKQKILRELKVSNTDAKTIFGVKQNIVLKQFDKVFKELQTDSSEVKCTGIADYGLLNIVRFHNGNLKAIEQEIKDLQLYGYSSRAARDKQLKKIKAIVDVLNNAKSHPNNTVTLIREKLQE